MNVNWDYKSNGTCIVKIDGQVISVGQLSGNIVACQVVCESNGSDKKDARDKAAAKAVQILKQHCYTIEVKSKFLTDGTKVDVMDVEVTTSVGGKLISGKSTTNRGVFR